MHSQSYPLPSPPSPPPHPPPSLSRLPKAQSTGFPHNIQLPSSGVCVSAEQTQPTDPATNAQYSSSSRRFYALYAAGDQQQLHQPQRRQPSPLPTTFLTIVLRSTTLSLETSWKREREKEREREKSWTDLGLNRTIAVSIFFSLLWSRYRNRLVSTSVSFVDRERIGCRV